MLWTGRSQGPAPPGTPPSADQAVPPTPTPIDLLFARLILPYDIAMILADDKTNPDRLEAVRTAIEAVKVMVEVVRLAEQIEQIERPS